MQELVIEANVDKLEEVLDFVNGILEANEASMKAQVQIDIAVEELFVNIAHYAYAPEQGMATIQVTVLDAPKAVEISFVDTGKQYNPLDKSDPDITLSAEERQIGGLGIFMVKKSMNDMRYTYENGQNILTILKEIS